MSVAAVVPLHFDHRLLRDGGDLNRVKPAAVGVFPSMNLLRFIGANSNENGPLAGFRFPAREISQIVNREPVDPSDCLQSRPRARLKSPRRGRPAQELGAIRVVVGAGWAAKM